MTQKPFCFEAATSIFWKAVNDPMQTVMKKPPEGGFGISW
jgi:hypothetical protein